MASERAPTVLIVATKAPWPPVDGGRVVLWQTLAGLAALEVRVLLAAPVDPLRFDLDEVAAALEPLCEPHLVPARPRPAVRAVLSSIGRPYPPSVARHMHPAMRRLLERLLAEEAVDVVQVEHLQALAQVLGARRRTAPILLRAHNVESALWGFAAAHRPPALRGAFALEARRLAAWEGASVGAATLTLALSKNDVGPLERLGRGRGGPVEHLAAPFPPALKAGPSPLPGSPAVAVLIAGDWLPARDAAHDLMRRWWPEILRGVPGAHLHLFGLSGDTAPAGVTMHPAPEDSTTAFPTGSVVAVPLRHPTGVPVKCLEAWSRGLPVIAGADTARALGAVGSEHLLVADSPAEVARALARLEDEPGLRQRLVAGGREMLARHHDPVHLAERLIERHRWCLRRKEV